jgi:hypothetical protein
MACHSERSEEACLERGEGNLPLVAASGPRYVRLADSFTAAHAAPRHPETMKNSSLPPLVGERVANHANRESRVRGFFRASLRRIPSQSHKARHTHVCNGLQWGFPLGGQTPGVAHAVQRTAVKDRKEAGIIATEIRCIDTFCLGLRPLWSWHFAFLCLHLGKPSCRSAKKMLLTQRFLPNRSVSYPKN